MKFYGLFDPDTGEQVFEGTPSECAEFCGGTERGFYHRYRGTYHGYAVRAIQKSKPKALDAGLEELLRQEELLDEIK